MSPLKRSLIKITKNLLKIHLLKIWPCLQGGRVTIAKGLKIAPVNMQKFKGR